MTDTLLLDMLLLAALVASIIAGPVLLGGFCCWRSDRALLREMRTKYGAGYTLPL